jgi:hypothetical protein
VFLVRDAASANHRPPGNSLTPQIRIAKVPVPSYPVQIVFRFWWGKFEALPVDSDEPLPFWTPSCQLGSPHETEYKAR